MSKRKSAIRIIIAVAVVVHLALFSVLGCFLYRFLIAFEEAGIYPSITVDGEIYEWSLREPRTGRFSHNGVDLSTEDSLMLVRCSCDLLIELPDAVGPLDTAEAAAYHGISLLNQTYDEWTWNNQVTVYQNENANLWIVSGLWESREHNDTQLGFIILDAATGEVYGLDIKNED